MQFIHPLTLSRLAALLTAALGIGVLWGWALDITTLKSLLPGLTTLKPNAALGFLLSGVSLFRLNSVGNRWLGAGLSVCCAGLVLLLGITTLGEYVFNLNLGIDDLLFQVPEGASYNNLFPARMNPVSAVVFSIIASALILLQARRPSLMAQYLVLAVACFALFNLFGFLFGWDTQTLALSYKPVSLLAGIGFLILSLGVLATTTEFGVLAAIRSKLLAIVLGLAVLLLLVAIYAAFLHIKDAANNTERLEKVNEILWRVEKVAGDIELNIAAYRGFVLSGDEKFITPLPASRQRVQENLDAIKRLITRNSQLEKMTELEALIARRMIMCDEKIQLRLTQGMLVAAQAVARGQGEELNKQIRLTMDAVIQTELKLAKEFKIKTQINQNNAFVALCVTFVFSLGLILIVMLSLWRQIAKRTLAESGLKQSLRSLAESEMRYRLLIEHAPEAVLVLDADSGFYIDANSNALQLFGLPRTELIEHNPIQLSPLRQPDGCLSSEAMLMQIQAALAGKQPVFEWLHVNKLGQEILCEVRLLRLPATGRNLIRGSLIDITERKAAELELQLYRRQLETLVQNRTIELEAVNQELEAFAYSVSHDLRAPLRSIDGFSQALLEDYAAKLDKTGNDYLNRVRAASQRMGALIDDLLNLSRITRKALKHTPVNLSEIAQQIILQLSEASPAHKVEFVLEDDLIAEGDPGLLKIALENLLDNAWKYSAKTPSPRIEFGSFENNAEMGYYISDNGVGFDMSYVEKLFGAFQRLHHRDQFDGAGIGLATVKRIINRHGGRIWAESEMDIKTTFYFTLPKRVSEIKPQPISC